MARVILAMSGGVDSSVAAHLLKHQGHEVIGVFMRHGTAVESACSVDEPLLPLAPAAHHGCCTAADAADARRVAQSMGLPFYALDLHTDFQQIIDYFVDEYAAGRTPNPCVVCNHWIKFGRLFDYADSVGAEFVATGHYARLETIGDQPALLRGFDAGKDQSYVLFGIPRERLARMLLPVGTHAKKEIRATAEALRLDVADKPDSQEICFVTPGRHAEFVRDQLATRTLDGSQQTADRSGDIVTLDGRRVGRHDGIERFTIGQRKGLQVALGSPHYVVQIDADRREVVIGPRSALARRGLVADQANWLVPPPSDSLECQVQIRYRCRPVPATVRLRNDAEFEVEFDEPCHGVAPGQAAVCYDGDRLLGGGWIVASH